MSPKVSPKKTSPIPVFAVLAGGGHLPAALCTAALSRGWPTHVIIFSGQPRPENLPGTLSPGREFPLGAVSRILDHLKSLHVTHVALAGHLSKPSLFNLKPDVKGLQMLSRIRSFHDDELLRLVTDVLAAEGFSVVPVTELSPQLVAPVGLTGKVKPTPTDEADISLALEALKAIGKLDIGQAAVVHHGVIIGLEAVEGTDALIRRCASLRGTLKSGQRAGLLVKRSKPGQTTLADLPTVGPQTIRLLAEYGYHGLVVEAGKTLLIDQDSMLNESNLNKMLIKSVEVK